MDIKFREDFIVLWKRFFGEAELPIAFYYTNEEGHAELVNPDTVRVFSISSIYKLWSTR